MAILILYPDVGGVMITRLDVWLTKSEELRVEEDEDFKGKLLILGNARGGRTTTVLELARRLVIRIEKHPNLPIPVLLDPST
ncbi:hypothetical protein ACP6PL_30105 [Dapis sp. BLCC M126]|uniref:hypothetical protein n=1 Tax=Dapis sp. BLCC M126 TaxID=3400189 RepID=UPI003CFA6FCC